jgi:hypothetical protein
MPSMPSTTNTLESDFTQIFPKGYKIMVINVIQQNLQHYFTAQQCITSFGLKDNFHATIIDSIFPNESSVGKPFAFVHFK